MNARVTRHLSILVCMIGVALSIGVHVNAQASLAIQIDTCAIEGTTLTIKGRNFGGGVPIITVNDANASVSRNSDTEIVAIIPQLESGMYVLKIVRDAGPGGTVVTTLKIR